MRLVRQLVFALLKLVRIWVTWAIVTSGADLDQKHLFSNVFYVDISPDIVLWSEEGANIVNCITDMADVFLM